MRELTNLIELLGYLSTHEHVHVKESQAKTYGNNISGCSGLRGQELSTFAYNNKYAEPLT